MLFELGLSGPLDALNASFVLMTRLDTKEKRPLSSTASIFRKHRNAERPTFVPRGFSRANGYWALALTTGERWNAKQANEKKPTEQTPRSPLHARVTVTGKPRPATKTRASRRPAPLPTRSRILPRDVDTVAVAHVPRQGQTVEVVAERALVDRVHVK